MDLKVSCKTFYKNTWTYTLADRTEMKQDEWVNEAKKHIEKHDNRQAFNECLVDARTKRWYKNETDEDFALQLYAEKYCRDVEQQGIRLQIVKDELGYDQLAF